MKKTFSLLMVTRIIDNEDDRASFIHRWVEEVAKNVDQLYVIALKVGSYDLPKNVVVYSMGKERTGFRLAYVWNFYKNALSVIKKVDAIFCHQNQVYTYMSWPLKVLFRKRLVSWYAHIFAKGPLKRVNAMCDILLSSISTTANIKSKKRRLIGQGIDTTVFKPIKKSKSYDTMFYVGRINKLKGCDIILDAFEIVHKKIPSMKLVYIGSTVYPEDDQLKADLENRAKTNNLPVSFLPSVKMEEVAKTYASYDFFVNASPASALDKTNLESMACGTITFTSSLATKKIMVEQGIDKNLVYADRDAEDLAKKIIEVAQMSVEEKQEMEKKCRDLIIKHHNLEKLGKRIVGYCKADTYDD